MKTQILLSGVAALALLLGGVPASAVSLNIGGEGGLVSTGDGGSGSTETSVGVDSDDDGVEVDANVNTELLDGDSDGDGTVDIFGDKPLLETGGDSLVTVDTDDDEDALVTLFGSPDGTVEGDVGVEADVLEADRDEEVFLRLFGSGAAEGTASADIGGTESSDDAAVEVRLFGEGAGGSDSGTGGEGSRSEAPSASGTAGESSGTDATTTASTGGSAGSDDNAVMPPELAAAPGGPAAAAQARVAARGDAETGRACFSPTQAQIEHLLGRSSYGPEDAENWQQAALIEVVLVNICPAAAAQLEAAIAADADIGYMQAAVARNELIVTQLDPHSPKEVLAVEQTNEELTVYVY
jgi:hypothetical protein